MSRLYLISRCSALDPIFSTMYSRVLLSCFRPQSTSKYKSRNAENRSSPQNMGPNRTPLPTSTFPGPCPSALRRRQYTKYNLPSISYRSTQSCAGRQSHPYARCYGNVNGHSGWPRVPALSLVGLAKVRAVVSERLNCLCGICQQILLGCVSVMAPHEIRSSRNVGSTVSRTLFRLIATPRKFGIIHWCKYGFLRYESRQTGSLLDT